MVDEKPELNQKLLWLMAIRVLVVASILLPFLVFNPTDPGSTLVGVSKAVMELVFPSKSELIEEGTPTQASEQGKILQVLVAGVSIETLLFALLLRLLRHRPLIQGYLQLIGDQVLLTLILYKFGDAVASLSILYFFLIAVGGLLIRHRAEVPQSQ